MDFRRQAITMLESMGISVEFSHHEGAPGQQEIDLRYADALSTADNIMTFRLVMKQVALEQGVQATFMPKPFSEYPGSGMHTHLSLFEGDRNAFYESGAEYQLSKVGRSFIAGPAAARRRRSPPSPTSGSTPTSASGAAPQRTAGAGGEAPSYICWGHNRSAWSRHRTRHRPSSPRYRAARPAGRLPQVERDGLGVEAGRIAAWPTASRRSGSPGSDRPAIASPARRSGRGCPLLVATPLGQPPRRPLRRRVRAPAPGSGRRCGTGFGARPLAPAATPGAR